MSPNAVVAMITLATVCCSVHMFPARAMPKKNSESWRKSSEDGAKVPRFKAMRSCNAPRPKRDVLKCPSHCFPSTAPKAAKRLLERLVYASVWIHIVVELGPVQTGSAASWGGNVVLSILLTSIFREGHLSCRWRLASGSTAC